MNRVRRNSRVLRCVAVVACLAGTVTFAPFTPALAPVGADPASGPGAFSTTSTGNIANQTVPDGTCALRATALGGAGASSAATAGGITGGRGSSAASINATFAVLPLQVASGSVGGGGSVSITGGVGGGGAGADVPQMHDGAGGGGRTVVQVAGSTLVVAGGGGGAGAAHNNAPAGNGGAAGTSLSGPGVAVGANGSNGTDSSGTPGGGTGGQVAAGGAGGVHTVSPARNGSAGGGIATGIGGAAGTDLNYDGAGGGGAGYTGGGGGASTTDQSVTGAGGGGGSSFVAATSPVVAATAPASVAGAAGTQPALGAAGANGSMNLDWVPCRYDLALAKAPSTTSINAGGKITWTVSVTNNGPDPMTRGDIVTLTDTLPSGSNATSPSPNNVVTSITTTGGSNANMTSGAVTCAGVVVGSAMPASTDCSRAYAGAAGTPGSPSGGTRGLNVGETLTITYDQYISNTAACGTITNTAGAVDRPTINTTNPNDYVGTTATNTATGTVTINCYDLAVTKTVSPTPSVVQNGTISWTITVVNNGPGNMVGPDATDPNPLVITDTFPTTGVGVPTLASQTGSAGTCTFASPTITCPGSLNAGQQHSLTFSQPVNAGAVAGSTIANTATVTDPRTGDTNDSSTASTQVVAAPTLVLRKSLNGQNRFDGTDQFVMSIAGPGGGTATTAGAGATITGGVVTVATGTPGATYTLSETMAGGSASMLGQYVNSISCSNAAGGSSTPLPAGPGTSFTITPQPSDEITCTFTNTPRPAQVTIAKTSLGGVGTFNFGMTNLSSPTTGVTTTTAGIPAASTAFGVTTLNTAVEVTETVPAGWRITGIACVDANSAVTGNAGTFGTVAANVITIPAAFLEPAANITCTFTNEKLARLVIQKTASGGPGTFGYTTTGLTPATFDLSPNPPTTPTVSQTFADLVPGSYSVTEGSTPPFQLTDLSCVAAGTSAPGSNIATSVATQTVTATLVAGADYTCTYTNVRDAELTIIKTTVGGDETFTFTTADTGNTPDPTPSVTTASGVGSSSFGVPFPMGVTTRDVVITEDAPPAGWQLRSIVCTDATGATVGSGVLPSVTVTVVPGDVISCNFTNDRLPRVTIVKETVGLPGSFEFTGGTNGLPPSLTLDTTGSNPASSTTYELNAFDTATSITETVPANYTLISATCVDGSGTAVSTSLAGSALTIDASAIIGGANLTCRFVNSRLSAQVRVDKRWLGATPNDQVTISSAGGTNNPGLVSVADTSNEVDAGTAVTVFAGETLTFAEVFDVGNGSSYTSGLSCTGASDINPNDGLVISAADDGADIVCAYANSRIPNATKTAGSVTGPTPAGIYTVTYTVTMANPGGDGTYGALTDSPDFGANLQVVGATWTATSTVGGAPAGGAATGAGPFTLAPGGQAISATAVHTFEVSVSFQFDTYTPVSACGGPGTGLYNSVTLATSELLTADNAACVTPPAPPAPAIQIIKTAAPTTVTAANQLVTYSFEVTNTGNVDLASVVVSDPMPGLGLISCPASVLAPSATFTCTAPYTTTQADIDAGSIMNTATVDALAPNNAPVSDTDDEVVTATQTPAITVVKSANPSTVTAAGQTVTYSFLVTNTGNVTLSSVGVTDVLPGISAVTCPVTILAPQANTTCTATYVVSQSDINAGSINNTATATGTPPPGGGNPVTDTDPNTVQVVLAPSIDVVKTASPTAITIAGQTVTYSFLVTNTGNVSLSDVSVVDPLPGLSAVTCPITTLAPTDSTICTATYVATQSDVDSGLIQNTAIAQGKPPTGPVVTDIDSETVTATRAPAIALVKSAAPTTFSAPGQTITYSFEVTNIGNVALSAVSVSDVLPGLSSISCPVSALAPAAMTTCTASYVTSQADVDLGAIDNSATATGTPVGGGAPVTDADEETVTATRTPSIEIDKTANPTTVSVVGQTVNYTFEVRNTGNVTLTSVGVADPLPGLSTVTCPVDVLAPSASTNCTASYVVTQADLNNGMIENTAVATGTPPVGAGPPVTDSDDEEVAATRNPNIDIVKSATPNNVIAAGQTINYSFLVTNTGNVTLTSVGVVDPLPGLVNLTCPPGDLEPTASKTCTATYISLQSNIDAGAINNTATATGTPPVGSGGPVTDSDPETVTAIAAPAIQIVKSATPTTVSSVGETITYSFAVTNTGNVTLAGIVVTDPLPNLGTITCVETILAPTVSTTCSASYTVTQADLNSGRIDNTATVTGNPPVGPPVGDTDDETVTVDQAPSVDLAKSANPTTVTSAGTTVTYSFLVTNTGNVTLTGIGIVDPLPGLTGITCPVTTLAPSTATTCTATRVVTQADIDNGSIANTATVSGTPPSGPPVHDTSTAVVTATPTPSIGLVKSANPTVVTTAGQTVNYSFVVTNTGNVTLTSVGVTDPLPGLTGVSCPVATLAPLASTTCTASKQFTQSEIDGGSVTNVATASGTPPVGAPVQDTDDAVVTSPPAPAINLEKSASPNNVTAAGQIVTYSFVVTNQGNVTLDGIAVTDGLVGLTSVACPITTLAPGAYTTCTATYISSVADVNAGQVDNTATVTADPPVGPPVTDTATETFTATADPAIQLRKTALPTTVSAEGETVTYSFLVTNTGNVTLSGVDVTDVLPGLSNVVCLEITLDPGGSTTCAATYETTQADIDAGQIDNSATATGTPPTGPDVDDTDTETVTATQSPSIDLDKSVAPTTVSVDGDQVSYELVVTNTGNVTLTGIEVVDPLVGQTVVCPGTELAPGEDMTCTATYEFDQDDIDAGAVHNTATVTGTPPVGAGPPVTDTDNATVTAPADPSLSLVKSASPATVSIAGEVITYTFTVTNTGNVTLVGVGVSDPLPGLTGVTCLATTLAPTTSTTCSATYTTLQADVDRGSIDNTATASATPPGGTPVVSNKDSETVPVPPNPSLTLVKSATPNNVNDAGELVTYSFRVTNTGNVTLHDIEVADPLPGLSAVNCPATVLAPGAVTTCTATRRSVTADLNAGAIVNTATATGTPPVGPPVTDTDVATVMAIAAPAIQLVKSASPTNVTTLGEVVTYTFIVTNTGNVDLSGIVVTDPIAGISPIACPATTLIPDAFTTCTATRAVTQADLDAGLIVNTATATGTPPIGAPVSDADDAEVTATPEVGMTLTKSASPSTAPAAGTTITYTLVVTNTGAVTLTNVAVVDPLPGLSPVSCPGGTIAPGATLTCTATYVTTQADADTGSVANTATATGTPVNRPPIVAPANTTVTIPPAPAISLVKTVAPDVVSAVGQTVTFTFVATNTGNITLTEVVVTDALPGLSPVTCPSFDGSLAPGETTTCTATYAVTAADVAAGAIHNTASVSANGVAGPPVTSADEVAVSVVVPETGGLRLAKSVSAATVASGESVTYTIIVTNTGNVVLTGVAISDPMPGLTPLRCANFDSALDPGEAVTCTASYVAESSAAVGGRITNTASASGRTPTGTLRTAAASAAVAVTVSSDLPGTGADAYPMVVRGAAAVTLGWVMLLVGRRRRRVT